MSKGLGGSRRRSGGGDRLRVRPRPPGAKCAVTAGVIGRWVERGLIPASAGAVQVSFTGFPPIRESELPNTTVEAVY